MEFMIVAGLVVLFVGLLVLRSRSTSSQTVDLRTAGNAAAKPEPSALHQKHWIHGAADCEADTDPAIEVFRADRTSYILRQNKCLSYEAPFMYLLFNTTQGPLANPLVRDAIGYAIKREDVMAAAFFGRGRALNGMPVPESPWIAILLKASSESFVIEVGRSGSPLRLTAPAP